MGPAYEAANQGTDAAENDDRPNCCSRVLVCAGFGSQSQAVREC